MKRKSGDGAGKRDVQNYYLEWRTLSASYNAAMRHLKQQCRQFRHPAVNGLLKFSSVLRRLTRKGLII